MMRLATKTLTILAIAAALALAGCGGDDDSTTTGTGGETTVQQPSGREGGDTTPKQNGGKKDGGEKKGDSNGGKQTSEIPFREPTGTAPTDSGSLPNEGQSTATPGVPLAKGGDNSIQTFGVEAPADERVQAARVYQAYLDARADGEWALACSYLSDSMKRQLVGFGAQARGQAPPGCAEVMRGFTAGVSESALRAATDIHVLSMRAEGEQAFLIYRDSRGTPSQCPMNFEGGAWKVAAITGSALFLG
jgi:hypothetical protein